MARVDQIDLVGPRIPLRFKIGQSIVIPVSVKDPSDDSAVNITGRTYTAKIGPEGGASIATFLVTPVDLPNGLTNFVLTDTVTNGLAKGRYIWELWEDNRLILEGPVEIVAKKVDA